MMNMFLAFLLGISVGITLTTVVLVFMFMKYKRKSDESEERLTALYQAQFERLVANSSRVAGMIYDYATGHIPSIFASLGKQSFPTNQLIMLSMLFSWMYALDILSEGYKEDATSIALARVMKFEALASETIDGFKVEVNDFGYSRRFTFSWKGISAPFTLTPR
jgi:hypothetical protein